MHGGKSVALALKLRTDYAMNSDKTENGKLISAFACDPHTADAEFLLSKRQYKPANVCQAQKKGSTG